MSAWHDDEVRAAETGGRDYGRWLWVVVVALIALMLGVMWFFRDDSAHFSQVQVRHILIPASSQNPAERQRALELAQAVRQRVLDGEDFESLARQYSGDPGSGSRGGYLGWTPRGEYSEPFEEYIWNGDVGAISDLVVTEHGYHIIQVLDRKLSAADAYDAEIDRKAWEQHRAEEAERVKAGQQAPAALPNAPAVTGAPPQVNAPILAPQPAPVPEENAAPAGREAAPAE